MGRDVWSGGPAALRTSAGACRFTGVDDRQSAAAATRTTVGGPPRSRGGVATQSRPARRRPAAPRNRGRPRVGSSRLEPSGPCTPVCDGDELHPPHNRRRADGGPATMSGPSPARFFAVVLRPARTLAVALFVVFGTAVWLAVN